MNLLKFRQLIFREIMKIVATQCQILRLKCAKIVFVVCSLKRKYNVKICTGQ